MQFEIDLKLLKAANVCVSKEETRFYLKGVCLQNIDHSLMIIATDGHRLIAFKPGIYVPGSDFSVIMPTEAINNLKLKRNASTGLVTIRDNNIEIDYNDTKVTCKAIDGSFPHWQRVIPQSISGKTAQFNPQYVADFVKVLKELDETSKLVTIGHNGGDPAVVGLNIDIDYIALIMPVRGEAPIQIPAWCRPKLAAVA